MQLLIKILYIILAITAIISLYLMGFDEMIQVSNLLFTISIILMITIHYLKEKYNERL